MNIVKTNLINTNKIGVLPFSGDTPVSENKEYYSRENKPAKHFLYGALVASAGIIGLSIAARNGLFAKKASKAVDEIKDLDVLKNNPIVKAKKASESFAQVAIGGSREERLKSHAVNPLILQTSVKYPKSLADVDSITQRYYLDRAMQQISGMSYEDQYDEFKFLLGVLKEQPSGSLHWEFGGIPKGLKRDNYDRYVNEINALTKEVPELNDTVFYQYRFNEAVDKMDFSWCNKLEDNTEKTRFFTNAVNKIYGMSYEDQPKALNEMFGALKSQDLKTFDWTFVPYRDRLHGDNYDKAVNLINATSGEVPDLNKTVFYNYRIAEAFDKNDFVSCKDYIRENDKFKFFSNFTQKMHDMSYEDQPNAMRTLLEALKQEDLKVFDWTYTPARWNFKGDNFDKVANIIDEFSKEKPELNETVFKRYRVEEALDKWNFEFCDGLKTSEEKSGFFSDFLNRIYGMNYHDQQKGMSTLLEALKKQDLKTFTWNCMPMVEKLHGDNYGRFMNSINEVSAQIPELNDTVFYKLRMKEALDREDFSFYKKLKSEADKTSFFNSYMHKIYGMSSDDQPKAFDAVLTAVREENPKTFAWSFSLLPQNLKDDNHKKFVDAINKLTAEKPELNDTVFYKYRVAEALEKKDYSIYHRLKTEGEKAGFLTNIFNNLTKVDADNLGNEFTRYLHFIKTLSPEQIQNKVLFIMGHFPHGKNIDMAKIAVNFAKQNPAYSSVIVRHLVKYHANDANKSKDIIEIRQLLLTNKLKADETSRIINRADWFVGHSSNFNNLDAIYKNNSKLVDIRKTAFEYDVFNGFTSQEAQELVRRLTDLHETSQGSQMEKYLGMSLKDVVGKINGAINRQA